jgi:sulfur-oxidizing protein SoxZ
MTRQTRIKTKAQDGATEILVLVSHPMETGLRTDPKTKEKIPAHHIQKMLFTLNGKEVADVSMGQAVSKDPLVSIRLKGAKTGDKIKVTWSDNKGEKGDAETVVG